MAILMASNIAGEYRQTGGKDSPSSAGAGERFRISFKKA